MTFFLFPIIQENSTCVFIYGIWASFKNMYENIKLNITMKLLSNNTPNQSTCNTSYLILSFFWPLLLIAFFGFGFPFPFFCFTMTFFFGFGFAFFLLHTCFLLWLWLIFLLLRTGFLLCLLISTRDQSEYPKTSISHFLKYGENKDHVFTIDNTIALKKTFTFTSKFKNCFLTIYVLSLRWIYFWHFCWHMIPFVCLVAMNFLMMQWGRSCGPFR